MKDEYTESELGNSSVLIIISALIGGLLSGLGALTGSLGYCAGGRVYCCFQ